MCLIVLHHWTVMCHLENHSQTIPSPGELAQGLGMLRVCGAGGWLVWLWGNGAPLDLGPPTCLHCALEDLDKGFYVVSLCHLWPRSSGHMDPNPARDHWSVSEGCGGLLALQHGEQANRASPGTDDAKCTDSSEHSLAVLSIIRVQAPL